MAIATDLTPEEFAAMGVYCQRCNWIGTASECDMKMNDMVRCKRCGKPVLKLATVVNVTKTEEVKP